MGGYGRREGKFTSHKATTGWSYYYRVTETDCLAVGRQLGRSMRSVVPALRRDRLGMLEPAFFLCVPTVLCGSLVLRASLMDSDLWLDPVLYKLKWVERFVRDVGHPTVRSWLEAEDVIRLQPQSAMEVGFDVPLVHTSGEMGKEILYQSPRILHNGQAICGLGNLSSTPYHLLYFQLKSILLHWLRVVFYSSSRPFQTLL